MMLGSQICVFSHNYTQIDLDFPFPCIMKWNDLSQLKNLINQYSEITSYRDVSAHEGYKLALNNHTFSHMAQNIVRLWEQK